MFLFTLRAFSRYPRQVSREVCLSACRRPCGHPDPSVKPGLIGTQLVPEDAGPIVLLLSHRKHWRATVDEIGTTRWRFPPRTALDGTRKRAPKRDEIAEFPAPFRFHLRPGLALRGLDLAFCPVTRYIAVTRYEWRNHDGSI